MRGTELAHHVLVTARDGYRVVYSLAKLDPATQPHMPAMPPWPIAATESR